MHLDILEAIRWCNKVNENIHATTNRVPFELLSKEQLNPLKRESIIDRINLRKVENNKQIAVVL